MEIKDDDVLRYGDNENEPSKERIEKSFLPEHSNFIRMYTEDKAVARIKMDQDHKKEILQLQNSHELAKQKQTHLLAEMKFSSRLAASIFSLIFLIGVSINSFASKEDKKFGETIAIAAIGVLSGIFIGKGASSGSSSS